ncbi:hypothetical protein HYT53_03550 [Candidatus Woesearchaeota archaeon]|nr:hypothetical protein [Candidatus Woesearchaeota archaeon]
MGLVTAPLGFAKKSFGGGMAAGGLNGTLQGILRLVGFHQFFARLGGGLIAASIIKNPIDRRVILNESTKEAVYQLIGGE